MSNVHFCQRHDGSTTCKINVGNSAATFAAAIREAIVIFNDHATKAHLVRLLSDLLSDLLPDLSAKDGEDSDLTPPGCEPALLTNSATPMHESPSSAHKLLLAPDEIKAKVPLEEILVNVMKHAQTERRAAHYLLEHSTVDRCSLVDRVSNFRVAGEARAMQTYWHKTLQINH